jgi:hypothetical protein
LAGVALLLSLAALGLLALIIDMSLPIPHSFIFCAIIILLAAAANLPLTIRFRSKAACTLLATFGVLVLVWNLSDLTREKSFKRFYANIQMGMSKQAVQTTMQNEFKSSHFPPPEYSEGAAPNTADMQYELTDIPGRPGPWSALIMINLSDGKVAEKRYENN